MDTISFQQMTDYSLTQCIEDEVVLIDDLQKLHFCEDMKSDFIALLFCTQGNMELDINEEHYYVGTNDVLVCKRGTLLHRINVHKGCMGKLLCVTREYADRLLMRGTCRWESVIHAQRYPLLHLQSREQQLIHAYYKLFALKIENYYYNPQSEVDCIFLSFFQDFQQIVLRYAGQRECMVLGNNTSRQEELFKRFIGLLKENFRRERSVSFYAGRLCLTPKYLATVVKRVSGQGVPKWIDSYLIGEIKSLLRCTNLTVGEISVQLNFPNSSFFGKFVKARTGETPGNLRRKLRG